MAIQGDTNTLRSRYSSTLYKIRGKIRLYKTILDWIPLCVNVYHSQDNQFRRMTFNGVVEACRQCFLRRPV